MTKEEILSKIFHDIKGPLTSINGYIQLLSMDLEEKDISIEYMSELNQSCKDLLKIINSSREEIDGKFQLKQ